MLRPLRIAVSVGPPCWGVVAAIALLLLGSSCRQNTPKPLTKRATVEVYLVSRTTIPNSRPAIDPASQSQIFLKLPPVITSADVSTVQRREDPNDRRSLTFNFTPKGSQSMTAATTPAKLQELAILVNGQVASIAKVVVPISTSASISGGKIDKEREDIFRALTED
jgi:preprotein translocase subunit SecD